MAGVSRHIPSPDGHTHPPQGFESWDAYMGAFEQTVDRRLWDDSRRVGKAMRLAPSLEVFEALLAGQEVPVAVLDREWRKRYAA